MTDLGEFAAVISALDLLVTNDTGASHVAAATRTPSVVLFGPTRPDRWAPLDRSRHQVIDAVSSPGPGRWHGRVARARRRRRAHRVPPCPAITNVHRQSVLGPGADRVDRLNVLIWHIHGSYLNALARVDHDWILPVKEGRPEGYGGRGATFDLPPNMREVPAEDVKNLDIDVVVLQTPKNLREDVPQLLSPDQRRSPALYLEHNVPRPDAVNTRHPFADEPGLLVHVTPYNRLMWDNGPRPTRVIEHSVALDSSISYEGTVARGISVVNGMQARPRIAGYDLFLQARIRCRSTRLAWAPRRSVGWATSRIATCTG